MKPLEQAVLGTIREHTLITGDERLLVAASAGPDSSALLAVLAKLFPDNIAAAAYIDHRLRPDETGSEKDHVQHLCDSLGLAFVCEAVGVADLDISTGESPEAFARRLRFDALKKLMGLYQADLLALGHTRDDQVEEVLIRLIRGSGMNGLSGMEYRNEQIIRPLLNSSKQDILGYLNACGISFCYDSSNSSRTFLRNKIRLDLLPLLEKEFNPAIRQTILHTATILKDEDRYLDKETQRWYWETVNIKDEPPASRGDHYFSLNLFKQIPIALQRRVLEKLFWDSGSAPTFQNIEKVITLCKNGDTGKTIHFSHGLRVIKTADEIIFSLRPHDRNRRRRLKEAFTGEIILEGPGVYPISQLKLNLCIETITPPRVMAHETLYIDGNKVLFPLVLRAPLKAESFHPLGAPGRKKVSRYLLDKKIPKHLRHTYPVLVSHKKEIIGIPGLAVSEAVKISERTTKALRIWWEPMG